MEIMISVNPPYTDLIFSGYKTFEFRKKVLAGMNEGCPMEGNIMAYIYETKNKGGSGKVIGEVSIVGTYGLHYADKTYPNTELVEERFSFYKALYLGWCTLKKTKPNMNEGWFKSKRFFEYEKEIGLKSDDLTIPCNYALVLNGPVRYDKGLPLEEYDSLKGIPLNVPPKNMFRVIDNTRRGMR